MVMKLLIHDVRFGEPFQVRPCGLWRPLLLLAQWLSAWLLLDRQATVSAAGGRTAEGCNGVVWLSCGVG